MAQFDVHLRAGHKGYWVDCQTELMQSYDTRFVVPLMPLPLAPHPPAAQLNPVFDFGGERCSFLAQFAGSIPVGELGRYVGSLAGERYVIMNAIDFLLTGV